MHRLIIPSGSSNFLTLSLYQMGNDEADLLHPLGVDVQPGVQTLHGRSSHMDNVRAQDLPTKIQKGQHCKNFVKPHVGTSYKQLTYYLFFFKSQSIHRENVETC